MIVTFYSFKGGVGRSMALVNIGEILADWGYRVVLCDWDLEAPGLERYLVSGTGGPEAADREIAELTAREGLVDLFEEYKATLTRPLPEEPVPQVPATHALMGRLPLRRPSSRVVPVSVSRPRAGSLGLLGAGRRDGEAYHGYAEAVRTFDWDEFYVKWAGDAYIDFFRRELLGQVDAGATAPSAPGADVVLIDSRTGVTEQGGVCTHHLADLVVLLSAANSLNMDGCLWMARALTEPHLGELREGRPIKILPVASRIEWTAQKEELAEFRERFRRAFQAYAPPELASFERFAFAAEIPYIPFYSFRERVVAREPEEQREKRIYAAYLELADGIVRCGVASGLLPEPASEGRVARGSFHHAASRAVRVDGTVLLAYAREEREAAVLLARGLGEAGVSVAADFRLDPSADGPRLAEAAAGAAGAVLLVGAAGLTPALQAHLDYVLRRQALQPGFNAVLVLAPGVERGLLRVPTSRLHCLAFPAGQGVARDFFGGLAAELGSAGAPPMPAFEEPGAPFPGLQPFGEGEARFFFGRDREVHEAIQSLAQTGGRARWIQVEGPSGVGKTSFALAGLVPAARRGWFAGVPGEWTVTVCRPGAAPLDSLASALLQPGGRPIAELRARLERKGGPSLRPLLREAAPPDDALLLVIDQLEEVLSSQGEAEVAAFDAAVATTFTELDAAGGPPLYLITTLRTDELDRFAAHLPRLAAALDGRGVRQRLSPLGEEALREAVLGPVRLAGLTYESGLAERIVRDMKSSQGPALLALLLRRLWQARAGSVITHEAYDRIGGLEGVLWESAERLLQELEPSGKARVRDLLLSLVSPRGARLVVPRVEALAAAGAGAEAEQALRSLTAAQLVTVTEHGVEIAHDTLLSWPRLVSWIEQERTVLERREELAVVARSWEAAQEPEGGLPTGPRLAYFMAARPAGALARRFLAAAADAEQRQRRRSRRVRALAAAVAAAVLLLAVAGFWQRQLRREREERSRVLASTARLVRQQDPVRSLVLAIEANRTAPTERSAEALAEALLGARERAVLLQGGSVSQASFSSNGSRLVVAASTAGAVWNAADGRKLAELRGLGPVASAAFSPDGGRVLSVVRSGLALWDSSSGRVLLSLGLPQAGKVQPASLRRQPWGPRILPAAIELPAVPEVADAILIPGGEWALARTRDGRALLWDLTTAKVAAALRDPAGSVASIAVAPDGRYVATGDEDGSLVLWRVPELTRASATTWNLRNGSIVQLAFSHDGRTLAAGNEAGSALLWNPESGARLVLQGHTGGPVTSVAFSPDDQVVLTTGADGTARLWLAATGYSAAVLSDHEGWVTKGGFSPDGTMIVTAGSDHTARLWDVSGGKEIAVLRGHTQAVTDAEFSPDGRSVATASMDGTARLWTAERRQLGRRGLSDLLQQGEAWLPVTLTKEARENMLLSGSLKP